MVELICGVFRFGSSNQQSVKTDQMDHMFSSQWGDKLAAHQELSAFTGQRGQLRPVEPGIDPAFFVNLHL